MDYFDDLDEEATAAFRELSKGNESREISSATNLSPEMQDLLQSTKHTPHSTTGARRKSRDIDYLFKISSPITPAKLAHAAILPSQPRTVHAEGENGIARFCQVNELDIPIIKTWLSKTYPTFSPVLAPINKARKALSPFSACPTLGLDTSLPQHRPQSLTCSSFLPAQDEYSVWYFFYGTLADPSFLAQLFCSPPGAVPVLVRALIHGGKLRTWDKKYNALVDSPGSQVEGWAYEILSRDQENILRIYETANYEVVRVEITLVENSCGGRIVRGCTFRFVGEEHELD